MSKGLDRSTPPAPGPVRAFSFPRVTRAALPNGLITFAIPHGVLPIVTFRLVVHAGAEHDTMDTSGLAYLTTNVLEAGTRTRTADRLAWDFEKLGAELDVETVWDYAALTVTAPADRAEAALALLAEVVVQPALDAAEVERLKHEQLAELLQRASEPRALANDQAMRFVFSADSPYHRPLPGTRETVRALTAQQVADFYQSQWRPGSAALLAAGAIDQATLLDLAQRHFGDWSGHGQSTRPRVTPAQHSARVHLVHRAGSVQSEIRVAHTGVPRTHADYYPLVVANSILGGAFTSRLNLNLREKQGFTYGVRSGYGFRKGSGPFMIQTAVATDVTARALQEILHETTGLLRDGPSETELQAARDYLSGTVPLELQTTEQIAARASELFVFELPDDYFSQYRDELRGVTAEQARTAARQHVRPDEFVFTVVGDAVALEKELGALQLGSIEVHEIND
jgi:zinc protease